MECNRDEAIRAKELAEKKFMAKDIAGAKKFALKAHNLYPGLEGISQMVATLDILLSAENKINGETDFYAVLNVNSWADDETVKKQYRKLALMLHPDKNKSIGADGAFKLISEAWSVLSDKKRRSDYDQKRTLKGLHQKVPNQKRNVPNSSVNGFSSFASNKPSTHKPHKTNAQAGSSVFSHANSRQIKTDTFWTSCNRCKMQYEYLRIYLNHNLLCPNCHEPFLALESRIPSNTSGISGSFTFQQSHQRSSNQKASKTTYPMGKMPSSIPNKGSQHVPAHGSLGHSNFQWTTFSRTCGAVSTSSSPSLVQTANSNVTHHSYGTVQRENFNPQATVRRDGVIQKNNSSISKDGIFPSNPITKVDKLSKKRKNLDDGIRITPNIDRMPGLNKILSYNAGIMATEKISNVYKMRELTLIETRNMLMEKARSEIQKKLKEWNEVTAMKSSVNDAKTKVDTDSVNGVSDELMKEKKQPSSRTNQDLDTTEPTEPEVLSISVPDSDFHDFDKDRLEKSFESNQVWAAYDDDDGMPRFYCLIQKVISLKPFKMRYSWLNSKTNSELGPINWVGSGFTKTCGEFRVGRYEISDTVNIFSHRVMWEKGLRGVIRIVPLKGETWALYRNWSFDWNENTPDEVVHKYDMFEVLEDYNEEQGVVITSLVKVAGFRTVFHRHMDPKEVKRIPREEMFRFSHQVPSRLLTGDEAPNAPKGCKELDPAATPLELLQIITEAEEVVECTKEGTDRQ